MIKTISGLASKASDMRRTEAKLLRIQGQQPAVYGLANWSVFSQQGLRKQAEGQGSKDRVERSKHVAKRHREGNRGAPVWKEGVYHRRKLLQSYAFDHIESGGVYSLDNTGVEKGSYLFSGKREAEKKNEGRGRSGATKYSSLKKGEPKPERRGTNRRESKKG